MGGLGVCYHVESLGEGIVVFRGLERELSDVWTLSLLLGFMFLFGPCFLRLFFFFLFFKKTIL